LVKSLPPSLARRCRFRSERFVPLLAGRARIGWLRPELAARLSGWPALFASGPDKVVLLRPDELSPVVEQLAQEGFIPGWRNERYRIAELFEIERAAARPFGLATQAVHVNGIVDDESMWLARRSSSKPTDPGMLDNLVGGGINATLSLQQTLLKEAWEEAGIPAELAQRATRGGTVQLLREVPEGVQSELIHVYDLDLPRDFTPRNQDGEVAELRLAAFAEVRRLIDDTEELTVDAALVALDFFRRRNARPASVPAGAGRAT
jgi:8-oxo-dGTP pyrophosphatase MutT (NUDIX family)